VSPLVPGAATKRYGIKSRQDARELVNRARARSKLSEAQALTVAQEQVRATRRKP
jgi:hypothetical protein